jgi:hypothetical protein
MRFYGAEYNNIVVLCSMKPHIDGLIRGMTFEGNGLMRGGYCTITLPYQYLHLREI